MKFNKCDFGIGAAYSLALWPIIGPLTILSAPVTAWLWARGGVNQRIAYRIIGCTAAVCWFSWWGRHELWVLACAPLGLAWITTGYSMPDFNQTKASRIGTFWTWAIPEDPIEANVATRSTYGALAAAAWIVAPFLHLETWEQYLSSICLMAILFGLSVKFLVGEVEL